MIHKKLGRCAAALAILLVLAALPVTAFAAQSHKSKGTCGTTKTAKPHKLASSASGPVIQFGQFGGNIRPWDATIDADGTVSAKGITVAVPRLADPKNTLNGLLKLTDTESFWSMPATTACSGTNPDVASRYIRITSNTGAKKVSVHGGCVSGFNELFALSMATASVHF